MSDPYPRPGAILDGKYRIERPLGEGGMSAVFQATHLLREAPVALKFLSPAVRSQVGAEERFINEAVAASRVDSDHVVKIFDVGRLPNGAPYLVMDFLEGRDLSDVLAREGPRLAVARAVHFVLQILRALHAAHGAGIVHRDMKPSNCFVGARGGEPDFLRVIDFGISKVLRPDAEQALTGTSSIMGTPLYMSPEQARSTRDVDLRTDLYSTGAILYELLSGRPPHTAETASALLYKIFMTDPDPIQAACPEAPPALAVAVHRALARDPNGRFETAAEMARALLPFADERSASLRGWLQGPSATEGLLPPTTDMAAFRESDLPSQPPRDSRFAVIAIAVLLAAVVGAAGFLLVRHHDSPAASSSAAPPSAVSLPEALPRGTVPFAGAETAVAPEAMPASSVRPSATAPALAASAGAVASARSAASARAAFGHSAVVSPVASARVLPAPAVPTTTRVVKAGLEESFP